MSIKDYKGVLKTSGGKVTQVKHEYGDYYTIKVVPDKKLTWAAGEHALFTLTDAKFKGKKWRAFSLASVPEEGHMLLGFRTGNTPSPFKQHLIDNGLNANIKIRGPFGPFKLKDDAKPVVLFASGVGITPILSILKSVEKDQTREIHVVYASAQFYLFKDEIESIAKENPKIHVIYTQSIEETQGKLTALALQYKNEAYYYSSGAGNVIQDTKALLTSRGIEKNNMIDDYFMGY